MGIPYQSTGRLGLGLPVVGYCYWVWDSLTIHLDACTGRDNNTVELYHILNIDISKKHGNIKVFSSPNHIPLIWCILPIMPWNRYIYKKKISLPPSLDITKFEGSCTMYYIINDDWIKTWQIMNIIIYMQYEKYQNKNGYVLTRYDIKYCYYGWNDGIPVCNAINQMLLLLSVNLNLYYNKKIDIN